MNKSIFLYCSFFFALCICQQVDAQNFKIDVTKPTAKVSDKMWGVFFEDINMGADGGVYAELVKNRSFEFYEPFMGWSFSRKPKEGEALIINRKEENANNPRFLRVNINQTQPKDFGITNEGFRGMGIKSGLKYNFSVLYRQVSAGIKMHLELVNEKNEVIAKGEFVPVEVGKGWKKQEISFNATATAQKAKLTIWFEGKGIIDLDIISLFPSDTWKGRPGGMRADMVQMLADMKPCFIRFPGGCVVEGHDLSLRYQWKKTIGPVEDRELIVNRWNTELVKRPTPDYYQTFGLGFFEYFQIAEDIGAQPLPIINCGMACQFNTAEVVPLEELGPYIQDALDLIEFANGSVETKWGKKRAELGHPKPFNLKMMGIGNENWGPQYIERLQLFTKAIKEKYPDFELISSAGPDPDGEKFDFLNPILRNMKADVIDEHYYRKPDWFLNNVTRYDNYPRGAAKIFAGEYAAQSDKVVSINNKNTWLTALSEAAFLTGLERNADVVEMASYAPLFAHTEGWQWTPDMIWVDNLNLYGTPNYYVQKLYATNRGTDVVPLTLANKNVTGQHGYYASATIDKNTKELIIKIVNYSEKDRNINLEINGAKLSKTGSHTQLASSNLELENSLAQPLQLSPKEVQVPIKSRSVNVTLAPYSFNVVKFKIF